jgi:hypothetical protein
MDQSVAPLDAPSRVVGWTPIVLGALVATALSSILLVFGATIGLGVTSTAPSWRDASAALAILSGLYLIIQAMVCFGVGGYIAGLTHLGTAVSTAESEQRDGLYGLGAWALAVVLGTILAALVGSAALTRSTVTPSVRASAAEPLLSYEIDRMFRPAKRAPNADLAQERAEAGRILLTSSSHSGMSTEDRTYLVQLISANTGLTGPDAERRADVAIANSETAISRSRRSSVILAFSVAVALLLGAVVCWTAACAGGRHRDGAPVPPWLHPRTAAIGNRQGLV